MVGKHGGSNQILCRRLTHNDHTLAHGHSFHEVITQIREQILCKVNTGICSEVTFVAFEGFQYRSPWFSEFSKWGFVFEDELGLSLVTLGLFAS